VLYVNRVRSCCKIIINKCSSVSFTIYLVGVRCYSSGHCSNSDRSICCSAGGIRWCDLYCCRTIGVVDCNRCRKYTTIIILYVNCVRSCCKIIINKCPGVSSTIYLVGVRCNISGHCSNSDRSICCCTRCIRWSDLYCCRTISIIDCNRCRKYTSIVILYVNCVRSCCMIIITKCPGVSSTIYLVGVRCNTSGHGSNSDRSICCCTRCISRSDLYCCRTIGVVDCNRCRKYTSVVILYVNCVRSC